MLSLALLFGWAQSGVPWRVAPGLVLLSFAAILVPIVSKRNLYCHHICPFGAAQQLVRNQLPGRYRIPSRLRAALVVIPMGCLLLGLANTLLPGPVDLTGLEPFGAFGFRAACAATLAVAFVGIVGAMFSPMVYCRHACPTGAILEFLRFRRQRSWWTWRDLFAILVLGVAVGCVCLERM